jgi:hypothetical protein
MTGPLQLIEMHVTTDQLSYLTKASKSIFTGSSNAHQSPCLQQHHREAPEVYRPNGRTNMNVLCVVLLVLSVKGIGPNKLHISWKLLSTLPGLYILTQKAVTINASRRVGQFLVE